jgi:hypothetical protein
MTLNLAGTPRMVGAHVDMGAYESAPDPSMSKTVTSKMQLCPGDPLTFNARLFQHWPIHRHRRAHHRFRLPLRLTHHASGISITATSNVSCTWRVADLAPGMCGVILLTGVIDPQIVGWQAFASTTRAGRTLGELAIWPS